MFARERQLDVYVDHPGISGDKKSNIEDKHRRASAAEGNRAEKEARERGAAECVEARS